jgi:outer membrane receptor protein involved in Fe transport
MRFQSLSLRRRFVPLFLLFVCALAVFAQTETGQITGTIFDQTGGIIMGATITATDQANKAVRSEMSSSGVYVFANLQPGRYEVTATAPNFQTTKQPVTVTVGGKVGLDFHLQLGSTTQIVEVQEQATQVNTETQTVGANISGNEILNLPTITRNPYDLVKTVGNTTDADPTSQTRGVGVSMNGLRASDVGILLDGVPNRNNFDTKVAIITPLDSVGEVSVLTNSFTAEYGKAVSGVINVDTRRGSNDIHGTAYEFNRISRFTSNTFDNNANGIPLSPFVRNQFGFSAGGPIKKDKLFVFGNPEWIRVRSVATQTAVVATPQLIAASDVNTKNFFSAYGQLRAGLFPLQTFSRAQVCTSGACTSIPATTPIYQKVAYYVPADSGGGSPQNSFLFAGRVDYVMSDKTQWYFRYARYTADFFGGTVTNSPYVGYDTGEADNKNAYALSMTHVFTPTLVNQTKVSYNRIGILQPLGSAPIGPTLYTTNGATQSIGGSQIVYPGYSPFTPGNSVPFGGPQNYVQLNEDLTKVVGRHNWRFGGVFTYLQDNRTFAAYGTAVAALGTNQSSALNGLVTGQLNRYQVAVYPQGKFPCINGPTGPIVTPQCTLQLPLGPPNFSRSNAVHESGLYVQDSWKVRPRLTVNLGLRWEYFGPQASRNPNLDSNFYPGPGANIQQQMGTGTAYVSTDPKNPVGGLWQKDWHDFSPRIGLAWDVTGDGKTSLRGGYGLGWEPNFGNVTFNVLFNPPNYGLVTFVAGADLPTIPIPVNNYGPLSGSTGTKPLPRLSLRWVDPYIKTAYAHLWSGVLEHQFGTDMVGAIEYTGSKGVNLYTINTMNIPGSAPVYGAVGSGATGAAALTDRANPQYSGLNLRTNGGSSIYHALNARWELRNFRRQGVTLRMNYTWAHALDDISTTFSETQTGAGNLGVLDPLHPELDRGSADFDVRHRFTMAAVWETPYKTSSKVANAILAGWNIIPNFSARTGTPFSLWDCTNTSGFLCPRAMYDTPFSAAYTQVRTRNPNEFNYMSVGNPNSDYVNSKVGVSDFGPFPSGMTGRNVFRTPGTWNLDFAIHKNFSITERFKLQLRGEAFNVFNHSNLYVVYSNTDLSATDFVTATKGVRGDNNGITASTENRNLQLALKLIF